MTWTTARPTTAGWYWYRGPYHADTQGVSPVVVRVEPDPMLGGRLVAWQPFMDYFDGLENYDGEWQGPIEPEE